MLPADPHSIYVNSASHPRLFRESPGHSVVLVRPDIFDPFVRNFAAHAGRTAVYNVLLDELRDRAVVVEHRRPLSLELVQREHPSWSEVGTRAMASSPPPS